MLRESEAKEQLRELKRQREEGEISGYIYERGRESILRKIHYDEENGQRHRYTTRSRISSLAPPIPIIVEPLSTEEEDFIDERGTEELSVGSPSVGEDELPVELPSFNEEHFSQNSSNENQEKGVVIDFSSNTNGGKPIVIDWGNVTQTNYKRIDS